MAMLGTQVKASEVESPYKEVPRRGAKAAEASAAAKAAEARPPACPGRAPAGALLSHPAWVAQGVEPAYTQRIARYLTSVVTCSNAL